MKVVELADILESVKVASLRQDDVVVIRCHGRIDDVTRYRLEHELKRYFGDRRVLIHGNDMDIEIVRAEALPPPPPLDDGILRKGL